MKRLWLASTKSHSPTLTFAGDDMIDHYGNSNYSRYSDSSYRSGYCDPETAARRMEEARKAREAHEAEEEAEEMSQAH
jgi:hypothetical protein